MKKLTSIILFALLLCTTNLSFAQKNSNISKCEKLYHKNPQEIVVYKSDSLFLLGEYENSKEFNLNNINDTSLGQYYLYRSVYRLANSYSKLGEIDSAFYYLNILVNNSCDDRIIFVDKNFDTLRAYEKQWNDLKQKIKNSFVENIGTIKDTNLAIELFYLGILDQKYRVYLPSLGQYSKEDGKKYIENEEYLGEKYQKIIKENGLPTISMVGKFSSIQFFLMIQHSMDKRKYYKLVKKAWEKGDYDSVSYAMLTDRVLMERDKKQIYGTQLSSRSDEKKYPCKLILWPVKDFKNVNKRRKEMGFTSTVEEYVKFFSNGFIPEEYYK
ncbi:MAG: DUF6624 domain-containing protein [Bacteroidales bacterium]|jgi:hypothetical protein